MKVGDRSFRSIWPAANGRDVEIIDQTKLPHRFEIVTLHSLDEAATAIRDMLVRGAPLIGATRPTVFISACSSLRVMRRWPKSAKP